MRCLDLSVEPWDPPLVGWADAVAFSVPMHTATRHGPRARAAASTAPTCAYGLYAAMCHGVVDVTIAGEYEAALVAWANGTSTPVTPVLDRSPPRRGAHARSQRAAAARPLRALIDAAGRPAASVEASHGCAHRCRHCPVPVVYDGRIRIVDEDAVLADVAQLVAAGRDAPDLRRPRLPQRAAHSLRVVARAARPPSPTSPSTAP